MALTRPRACTAAKTVVNFRYKNWKWERKDEEEVTGFLLGMCNYLVLYKPQHFFFATNRFLNVTASGFGVEFLITKLFH